VKIGQKRTHKKYFRTYEKKFHQYETTVSYAWNKNSIVKELKNVGSVIFPKNGNENRYSVLIQERLK